MEQVKIFYGIPRECEEKINKWLIEILHKAVIIRVLQSSASSGSSGGMSAILHVTIFYKS